MFLQGQEINRSCKRKSQRWAACWHRVTANTTHPVPLTCDLLPPVKGVSRHSAGWIKCRGHRSCQRNFLLLKELFSKQLLTSAPPWSMALGSWQKIQPLLRCLQFPPQYLNFYMSQELGKGFLPATGTKTGTWMHQEEDEIYTGLGHTEREEGKYFNQTFLIRRECAGFSDGLWVEAGLIFYSVIHCL